MAAAPRSYPKPLQHLRWCKNGSIPDAAFLQRLRDGLNHVMAYRRKVLFTVGQDFTGESSAMGTSDATVPYWYFRFRSGHGATQLRFRFLIGKPLTPGEFPDVDTPTVRVTVNGTDYDTSYAGWALPGDQDPTDAPNELLALRFAVDISPTTNYEVAITGIDGGRPLAVTAYEFADPTVDATDYFAKFATGALKPIRAADREELLAGMAEVWRSNGAPLIMWVGAGNGSDQQVTGTTFKNIVDETSTTVDDTTPGILFDVGNNLFRHQRLKDASAATIPVTIAAFVGVSIGAGSGEVRIRDDSGATACQLTGITNNTPQWITSDTTLSIGGGTKFDIQARHTTAGLVIGVQAVCVYPRAA